MALGPGQTTSRQTWRSLAVQALVALCLLGVGGSIYSFYDSFSRYYLQRENLVFVSTAAEVELARYSNALLRVVATGGRAPEAVADAELRLDIFLSRLDLYRAGSVNATLFGHEQGRALLARIETIETLPFSSRAKRMIPDVRRTVPGLRRAIGDPQSAFRVFRMLHAQ